MIAVISDVHSNLAALTAVLAEAQEADVMYCAGDVVGYGPNPNECCALIRDRDIKCVQGNHDFVCANLDRMDDPDGGMSEDDRTLCQRMFEQKNTAAQAASLWTNSVLTPENREFLRELPTEIDEHGLTIVHGKPGSKSDRLNEYMLPGEMQGYDPDSVRGHMLVVGHSHIPIRTASVVNPGSVGQPRDRDWRASFLILKDAWYRFSYIKDTDMSFRIVSQLVRMRRVPYDVRKTVERIKAEPDLPDTLGDRLTVGL